jgi:hypothetical protein
MVRGGFSGRTGAWACLALALMFPAPVGAALEGGDDPVFSPGDEVAMNAICGGGRSGRSWSLFPPDPERTEVSGAMAETIVPVIGRTDIVSIGPGDIIPCVRVTVSTDARGTTAYAIEVDAAEVNAGFAISDIHTGEPLELCAAGPAAADPAASPAAAVAASSGAEKIFSPGHEAALNALSGDGRSGRSWALLPSGDGVSVTMEERIAPAVNRIDIVRVMPGGIIPCVRVTVATDALGSPSFDLAVDAANVNGGFMITDIHSGERLRFCSRVR